MAEVAQWSESSRKAGSVTFTACSLDSKPFVFQLANVRIPFEPSCYQGDGTETRLTICFSGMDDAQLKQQLAAIEESIGATTSCFKDDSSTIRCKINIEKVRSYDAAKARIETPKAMRGWTVNANLHLRGKWSTHQGCGLSIEATDLQFLEEARDEPPCPF